MSHFDPSHLRRPALKRHLRLGFVGGGRGGLVGEWHAAGARLSNQWNIVAGALSSDPENAARSAGDWVIAPDRSYADWREMARNEAARPDGVEAVAICTPNFTHHDIAEGFLEAGIDVICDKPMTTMIKDAGNLVALQKECDARLFVTYPYTHHAMARQASLMIRASARQASGNPDFGTPFGPSGRKCLIIKISPPRLAETRCRGFGGVAITCFPRS